MVPPNCSPMEGFCTGTETLSLSRPALRPRTSCRGCCAGFSFALGVLHLNNSTGFSVSRSDKNKIPPPPGKTSFSFRFLMICSDKYIYNCLREVKSAQRCFFGFVFLSKNLSEGERRIREQPMTSHPSCSRVSTIIKAASVSVCLCV